MNNKFIDLRLTTKNMDIFIIRNAIFEFIKNHLMDLKGDLLDVGCGIMPYRTFILQNSQVRQYTGMDLDNAQRGVLPDAVWNGEKIPFENDTFDCALLTEVLEHCPNPASVLKEIHRVLKPNGIVLFTVPFLWNLHEVPYDEFRYTPFSLKRLLDESNFQEANILATGAWDASLAQMLGLWVKRRKMKKMYQKLLSWLILPIIKILIRQDKNYPKYYFHEGFMPTGFCGIAKK